MAAITTRDQGQAAEDAALRYLQQHGLKLLQRNFHCRRGEIDLIMQQGDTLVFVEVRYRRSDRYGSALESVNYRKQQKIIACARFYLSQRRLSLPSRFDIVAVAPARDDTGTLSVTWVKQAFDAF